MKLLLDQNLSHRLVKHLDERFPGSVQVSFLGMGEATDEEIWEYAREKGYVIEPYAAFVLRFSCIQLSTNCSRISNGTSPLIKTTS
jgi:predicted nuclease of predicted toxin-antitoxin system